MGRFAPNWRSIRNHQPGYVYVVGVRDTDYYKIGKSDDPVRRLHTIQRYNPHEVYIEFVIKTDAMGKLEKQLHRQFKSQRIRGEWFELSAADLNSIRAVNGTILHLKQYHRTCGRCGKQFSTYYEDQTECGYPCVQQANQQRRRARREAGLPPLPRFGSAQNVPALPTQTDRPAHHFAVRLKQRKLF